MILVVGATGQLGSEIIRRLREKGEAVRGLVRSTSAPEKIARLREMGAETVTGNLRDRASLDAACQGVRAVISTVTVIGTAQAGDSFEDTDAAGTISLVEAAKAAGAEHFVFISFDSSRFPETPLFAAKRAVEKHLRSGGIDFTIIHPGPFMEVWLGPMLFGDPASSQVKIFGAGEGRIPYVSAGDVAEAVVRVLSLPSARNATIAVGGPEAITQREVVGLFEQELGRQLEVTAVPEQALEAQLESARNPFEQTFAGLMLGLARLDEASPQPSGELSYERTSVRDFVKRAIAG